MKKIRNGTEKFSEVLGFQLDGISHMSVLRMLKRRGYHARKPTWKFSEKNGNRMRNETAGGIDWWRCGKEILTKKLIPFAKRCKRTRPSTIVQEEKAPSHAHKAQLEVSDFSQVMRMLWPGNSPDLNMIEHCRRYMKR